MTAKLNKAVRRTAAVLAVVALGAGATACGSSDDSSSTAASSSTPTSSSSSLPSSGSSSDASGGSSNSSGGSSSGNGASGSNASSSSSSTCRTANLRITAKNQGQNAPGAAPGLGAVLITFTNNGADCRMAGFPGVDLKTNYGTESVERDKQEVGIPFTLRAGKTATANVVYTINNTGGSGVEVTGLVITPPNETHSVTAPVTFSEPVSDKNTGRLEVTPVFKPGS
ncbi:DUF4232 domain-containing protein [Streptomyces sp. PTM05]|uniref:DUF4232 domain-containing protein n=1 Tax=Streptantibioticus parmotrematis TaxID=2873249 RepID=A0ABS7QTP4_9ACTN|nr:DUF4232 domain-containing protein [Streptantibioticus parmotrematis]MBY8886566.1 DUF4232 domain-containing protein [Streptantibioticus parmotrematis]